MSAKSSLGYNRYIILTGIASLLTGLIVIAGWLLNITAIKSILSRYVSMKFNTALCFVLLGLAVLCHIKFKHKGGHKLTTIVSLVVVACGIITLLQQLLGYDLGVDQLFYPDLTDQANNRPYPGRMSPLTAVCFILTGIGIFIVNRFTCRRIYKTMAQLLFHFTTFISFIAVMGYIFHVPDFYEFSCINSMAIHTAIMFLVFSFSLAFLNPDVGFISVFTGSMIGNVVARRLFTKIFTGLFITGYLSILTYRCRLMPPEVCIALLTVMAMGVSLFFIWKKSLILNKIALKEKQATENLSMLVESAPYALILANDNGTIIHVNFETEKLYGYESGELIGKDFKLFMPRTRHEFAQRKKDMFFASPGIITLGIDDEVFAVKKNGKEFPVEIVLTPIKTDGETNVLATVIDITARKTNETIIKNQLIELQLKNQELEQFNYIASHDLQEPLRTVANYIELLEEDYPDQITDEIKVHLQAMGAATTRMSRLVRSLLDFGKLGRNRKLTNTNCQMVVNEVIADLANLIKNNRAVITITGELPITFAYETELHQLFLNLINNAIKFTKKDTLPLVKIGCEKIDGFYKFYVSDNGIGIDPAYTERIFNIFQRLNKEEDFEGYGIGLANCRKIAEMHGGRIWVESEPGKGSTFIFTIINFKA